MIFCVEMCTLQLFADNIGLFTPGYFMRFLWSDSYPIVKIPGVNVFQNTFEMDLNPVAQTSSGGRIPDENWTSVNASVVETTPPNFTPPKM